MQNSEALFRDKPVWQAIFSLVGPSILSVLVMVVYNMTDLFFIGLLRDTAQTAAVSIVSPVFTLVSAGATVLGMGGCAVAAAATVLGNLVACAFYLVYMLRHSRALSLAPADALRDPARLGRVLALGLPNGVSSLLAGCAGSFSNRLLAGYGTAALAAMAAADKATMVVSLVQMGICMGVQPLLAYNVGARDLGRLRAVIRRLLALTIGFGAAFAAACLMGQEALLRLFLSDAEALALGRSLLPWLLLGSPLLGVYYLGVNFLQASGRAAAATVLSALRQGALLLPALYLLHALLGLPGLAAARAAADVLGAGIAALLFAAAWRRLTRR